MLRPIAVTLLWLATVSCNARGEALESNSAPLASGTAGKGSLGPSVDAEVVSARHSYGTYVEVEIELVNGSDQPRRIGPIAATDLLASVGGVSFPLHRDSLLVHKALELGPHQRARTALLFATTAVDTTTVNLWGRNLSVAPSRVRAVEVAPSAGPAYVAK